MTDRTEQLIREAFTAEADHAPDSRTVLAELARRRAPRRRGTALIMVTAAVVAVALAAVAIPSLLDRTAPAAGPQDQNLLLLGLDRSKRAEILMFAHLDADGTAALVALPDSIPRSDGTSYPLYEVYDKLGADQLREDVERVTGQRVDHYAVLNMADFGDLATAVGGVPVCLKEASRDPETGVSFRAGTQTVAGERALDFLRQSLDTAIPYPATEERQQAFLTGLASRAGDVDPRAVLRVLGDRLRTDRDLDVLALAERLESVRGVRFADVTADMKVPMDVGPNREIVLPIVTVREFVTDMFAGASHPGGPGTPELPFTKEKCVY